MKTFTKLCAGIFLFTMLLGFVLVSIVFNNDTIINIFYLFVTAIPYFFIIIPKWKNYLLYPVIFRIKKRYIFIFVMILGGIAPLTNVFTSTPCDLHLILMNCIAVPLLWIGVIDYINILAAKYNATDKMSDEFKDLSVGLLCLSMQLACLYYLFNTMIFNSGQVTTAYRITNTIFFILCIYILFLGATYLVFALTNSKTINISIENLFPMKVAYAITLFLCFWGIEGMVPSIHRVELMFYVDAISFPVICYTFLSVALGGFSEDEKRDYLKRNLRKLILMGGFSWIYLFVILYIDVFFKLSTVVYETPNLSIFGAVTIQIILILVIFILMFLLWYERSKSNKEDE